MSGNAVVVGNYSYSISPSNNTVLLTVNEILNVSTGGTGTVRLELWLTTSPWNPSGSNTGYEIAKDQLAFSTNGTLAAGQYFLNISDTVAYAVHPPAGTYYVTLAIAEYSGVSLSVDNGFVIDSANTLPNFLVVDIYGNLSQGSSTTAQPALPVVVAHDQTVNANASIAASILIASVSDPNNYAITAYDFRDDGVGGGYFSLSGIKQAANAWITVSAADLSKLTYVGGTGAGSETVDVAVWDGQWSQYKTATVTTKAIGLPVVTVTNASVNANAYIQASSLITSVSDPNNYAITSYAFRDDGVGGGYFSLLGVKQAANAWITVSAADLSKLAYVGGSGAGSESVDVAAWDGQWSNYQTATVTTTPPKNNAPVLTVLNQIVIQNQSIAASTLIASVTDPNGLPVTLYDFRDDGVGGGYFSLSGVKQAENTWITVSSADLSKLTYVGGNSGGSETVDVAAWDGQWSYYKTATVTTIGVAPPVVVVNNQTVNANAFFKASNLIASVSDPNNFKITYFDFRDNGSGGGYFSLDGVKQAASAWITVSAADLAKLVYVGGAVTSSETVDVAGWDGYAWSPAATATVITQSGQQVNPPVITVMDRSVNVNASFAANLLIASVIDPNHNAITYYDFRDDGLGGGYFSLSGVKQTANTWITVSVADLSKLVYVGGTVAGNETVDLAAWDGYAWSNVASSKVTTTLPQNLLPIVSVQGQSVNANAYIQASSLIASVSDPNNYAITSYAFRDDGTDGGYFSLLGVKQAANAWITVSSADLSKLTYVGGSGAGTENVDVAAWDGQWSYYQTATVTTTLPSLPIVVAHDQSVNTNASIQASILITSKSDPNNNAITSYEFRDNGDGGGYLSLSGVKQAAHTWIVVSGIDLQKLSYVGGTSAGTETVDIKVFNNSAWSNYATAQVVTAGTSATNPVLALLTDPGIKADVAANLSGNNLSYAGMLKVLNDAASGGIGASEFADLHTLEAQLNVSNGIAVSSYVAYICDRLVDGDPWNATWTGGALTTTALGNLATGTSQSQMTELIQKWFLGGDLPAPTFDTTRTVTYVNSTSPLYNLTGIPSINDINQGSLGDCYLLASLAEVAQCEPDTIKSMITDNGNGTYGVRFYINGNPVFVTVNTFLPVFSANGAFAGNTSSAIWSSLIEKAYVELNAEPGFLDHPTGNVYNLINGGSADPISQITGRNVVPYDSSRYTQAAWNSLKNVFITAIQNNQEVDLGSFGDSTIGGKVALVAGHMFSGIGYDSATGEFVLRNPWGASNGQAWLTQFEATMVDIFNTHGIIFVTAGSASALPQVASNLSVDVSTAVGSFQSGHLSTISSLSDSAAHVQASLDVLQTIASSGLLSSITLTDAVAPVLSLTSTQLALDGLALSRIESNHTFFITGNSGNETIDLSNLMGNNNIDGGAGIDTVVYGNSRSDSTLIQTSNSFSLTDNSSSAGTDTLLNVERIKFSDGGIALDVGATQPAGQSVLLLGAVLPGRLVFDSSKQALLGAAIDLFDQGYSLQTLSGAVMRLPIWDILTGKATPSNTDIATYLLTNVNGVAPDATTLAYAVSALNTETSFATQGNFLWHLAESTASLAHVGLVGLASTGLAYG